MLATAAAAQSGGSGPRQRAGILTIDTFGSSFDTLLAVYTGSSVNSSDSNSRQQQQLGQ